jgi:uncharacterized membrane protein
VPQETSRCRRVYIDWARGLAVLLMIDWHTADALTRAADRHSRRSVAPALGGFAAPLFPVARRPGGGAVRRAPCAKGNSRGDVVRTICRRGLEIFILAFRSGASVYRQPWQLSRHDIPRRHTQRDGPGDSRAGLVGAAGASTRARVLWYAAGAAAIALMTPIVRTAPIVGVLPLWFQWYLKPAGDLTTFTLFPWAGFVFAGAACGVILATAEKPATERRAQFVFAAAGVLLVVMGQYLSRRPSIYQLSEFWTSSPTWFAIRVGVLMTAVAFLHLAGEIASHLNLAWRSLARFGRSSLFVYWIHVELVYGYATWAASRAPPLWGRSSPMRRSASLMYRAVISVIASLKTGGIWPRARSRSQTVTA